MLRTFARVHARHTRSRPRSLVANDQPSGTPSSGASALAPQREHVWVTTGNLDVRG
jgi:hypothetical protein